jgi:DNA-binding NarL/FixJ family response regulator
MINVILIDHHEVVRRGLQSFFNAIQDIVVRAQGGTLDEVSHLLGSTSNDILVTELALAGGGGIEAIRRVRRKFPELRILVFTSDNSVDVADRALKAGAQGYITKDSSAAQIVEAIRQLAKGRLPISEHIAEQLMMQLVQHQKGDGHQSLTPREMDVFLRIARGGTCTEIARSLFLSVKTISSHKSRIMDKLNFSSTAGLVQYAVAHKLIDGYVV